MVSSMWSLRARWRCAQRWGAGDAFLSSFALAWKRGLEPSEALMLASQAAVARLGQWAANTFPPMFGQDAAQALTL